MEVDDACIRVWIMELWVIFSVVNLVQKILDGILCGCMDSLVVSLDNS